MVYILHICVNQLHDVSCLQHEFPVSMEALHVHYNFSYSLQGSNQDTTSDNPPHSIPAEGPATIEGNIAVVLNTLFG